MAVLPLASRGSREFSMIGNIAFEEKSVHRTTLGDFELTILSDGNYYVDGGAMFGVIPRIMWEKRIAPDERNTIPLATNSLLVRTGKQNVLIETGIGNKLNQRSQAIYRNQALLMKSFEQAGISPDEIDIVINTHLHFDHCGWNTHYKDGKPVATFPAPLTTSRKANCNMLTSSMSATASAT